jgi:alanine racemase
MSTPLDPETMTFTSRPTLAEVDLTALRGNLCSIRSFVSPAKVMGVVKANGYGHGLVAVAQAFQDEGIDYLAVAYIEEAIALRRNGISVPILVFGGLLKEQLELYIG